MFAFNYEHSSNSSYTPTMRSLIAVFISFVLMGATARATDAPESYWRPYLRGMKEPVLSSAKLADGDFQFRWTRLVGYGDPVSIRVWKTRGTGLIRAVRLEFHLDHSVGRISRDQTIYLSEKQLAQLQSYLAAGDFWQPFQQPRTLGGAHWLFELQDSSGYHFVSIFSPALLVGDPQYQKTTKDVRKFRQYIRVAAFLLSTTRIFPDELKPYR